MGTRWHAGLKEKLHSCLAHEITEDMRTPLLEGSDVRLRFRMLQPQTNRDSNRTSNDCRDHSANFVCVPKYSDPTPKVAPR